MAWFEEFLLVLAYSTRTQLAIFFGILFFFGLLLLGNHISSNLVFQGMFAPLENVIRPFIFHRYESEAWGSLSAFLILAFKCYRKDKRRLFSNL